MNLQSLSKYLLLSILLTSASCSYDPRKELEKDKVQFNTNNPKYLRLYLQTTIDSIINELPYQNHNKILSYINSMYINTKYANIPEKTLKNQLLKKITEIKKMIQKFTYNRVLTLKLEQLRKISYKLQNTYSP